MSKYVFDASALLALLFQETGHKKVAEILEHKEVLVSAVNFVEVGTKLVLKGMPSERVYSTLACLQLEVVFLNQDIALQAAFSSC